MSAQEALRLLTVDEVAERLHVHPVTVRRLITDGELPVVRIRRVLRVREDEVEQFLRRREA